MTKFKNVESKLTSTGMKYDHNPVSREGARQASRGGPRKAERTQRKSAIRTGAEMLLQNGPPVEAANVVVYDANTNENIYSHFENPPPKPTPPPRIPPREREVPLNMGPSGKENIEENKNCLLYTSPSPRDLSTSRMPSSA